MSLNLVKIAISVLVFLSFATAQTSSAANLPKRNAEANRTALAKEPKFVFAIAEIEGQINIFINTVKVWESEQRLTDNYSKEERALLEPILDEANLCNLMDSTYEPCLQDSTMREMRILLDKLAFMQIAYSEDFQNFINSESDIRTIEFDGEVIDHHSRLYEVLFNLYDRLGVPVDMMGDPEFTDEDRSYMEIQITRLNDVERYILRKMAKAHLLNDYKKPLFDGVNAELEEKILGYEHEEWLKYSL